MKLRLLLTSALFLFVQIPTMQAQETADLAKITCEQLLMETLEATSHEVLLWISGYYNGKRDNTIIDLQKFKAVEPKVNSYCYQHRQATAVKNVFGFDK